MIFFNHCIQHGLGQILRLVPDWLETHHHHQDFQGFFNKQKLNIIYINMYINSIVVLTVVPTPQSITTNTINSTLSSYSLFLFHTQQYNSHHFLSIFLIFKIIKTSFYTLIYSLSYFIISYNLETSNLIIHIHQNFERIFLRIEKR